jgi:hypothetical protein
MWGLSPHPLPLAYTVPAFFREQPCGPLRREPLLTTTGRGGAPPGCFAKGVKDLKEAGG